MNEQRNGYSFRVRESAPLMQRIMECADGVTLAYIHMEYINGFFFKCTILEESYDHLPNVG